MAGSVSSDFVARRQRCGKGDRCVVLATGDGVSRTAAASGDSDSLDGE